MKYFFKKGFGFYALKPVCIVVELLIISEMRKLRLLSEFNLLKVGLISAGFFFTYQEILLFGLPH